MIDDKDRRLQRMDILTLFHSGIVHTLPTGCAWCSLPWRAKGKNKQQVLLSVTSQTGCYTCVLPAVYSFIHSSSFSWALSEEAAWVSGNTTSELNGEILFSLFGNTPLYFTWLGYMLLHNKPHPKLSVLNHLSAFCGLLGLTLGLKSSQGSTWLGVWDGWLAWLAVDGACHLGLSTWTSVCDLSMWLRLLTAWWWLSFLRASIPRGSGRSCKMLYYPTLDIPASSLYHIC